MKINPISMKSHVLPILVLVISTFNSCNHSLSYNYPEVVAAQWDPSNYERQRYAIGMASLKGFRGNVYYLGSDEIFHYFKVEKYPKFFRVKQTEMNIDEKFPVGTGEPYLTDVPHR